MNGLRLDHLAMILLVTAYRQAILVTFNKEGSRAFAASLWCTAHKVIDIPYLDR